MKITFKEVRQKHLGAAFYTKAIGIWTCNSAEITAKITGLLQCFHFCLESLSEVCHFEGEQLFSFCVILIFLAWFLSSTSAFTLYHKK